MKIRSQGSETVTAALKGFGKHLKPQERHGVQFRDGKVNSHWRKPRIHNTRGVPVPCGVRNLYGISEQAGRSLMYKIIIKVSDHKSSIIHHSSSC